MHRKLDWMGDLAIDYDTSTFDTDPFEPQPDGIRTIFPFWYQGAFGPGGLRGDPLHMPQDHTLFIILRERDIRIWVDKLDWIADRGGMALLNTHPDYMRFDGTGCALEEYSVDLYAALLAYIQDRYSGHYWQPLAGEMARFWKEWHAQTKTPDERPGNHRSHHERRVGRFRQEAIPSDRSII